MSPENNSFQVSEHIIFTPENEIVINHIEDKQEADLENEIEEKVCALNKEQTDKLSFSDAFKYYRDCLGKNETFFWKSNVYSTLLSHEMEEVNLAIQNSTQIDKEHLVLQNEIIGNHSE